MLTSEAMEIRKPDSEAPGYKHLVCLLHAVTWQVLCSHPNAFARPVSVQSILWPSVLSILWPSVATVGQLSHRVGEGLVS